MRQPLLLFAPIFLIVSGCSIAPYRLETSYVKHITPGKTSRAEVEAQLGQPKEVVSNGNNVAAAKYFFWEISPRYEADPHERTLRPADILVRTLSVRYDTNGVVAQKLHDESFTPVRRSLLGWFEVGPQLDRDTVRSTVQSNVPSSAVIKRLGEPIARWLDADGNKVLEWFYLKDRKDRNGQAEGASLRVVVNGDDRVIDHRFKEVDPRTESFLTDRDGIASTGIAFCFEEPEPAVRASIGPVPSGSSRP